MTYFVSDHLTHGLTHQFFRDIETTGKWIRRTGLHHEPVPIGPHVVVVPDDVALDDLSRAWIRDTRSLCISSFVRRPPYH